MAAPILWLSHEHKRPEGERVQKRPDAVKWLKSPKPGQKLIANLTDADRVEAVNLAEQLLEVTQNSLELAWVRDQGMYYFATLDPSDTEFFPTGHLRERQSRYEWHSCGEGIQRGWLIDG